MHVYSMDAVPDDNVCHLISSAKLLIVNTNNWYDPSDLSEELFIRLPKVPEVFDGDCGLAVTIPHVDPSQALLWGNVQVDYQIGLLPGRFVSREGMVSSLHFSDHTTQFNSGCMLFSTRLAQQHATSFSSD